MNEINCFQQNIGSIPGWVDPLPPCLDLENPTDLYLRLYTFMIQVSSLLWNANAGCSGPRPPVRAFCESIPQALDRILIQVAHDLSCTQNVTYMQNILFNMTELKGNVWFPFIHYQMVPSCITFDTEIIIPFVLFLGLLFLVVLYFLGYPKRRRGVKV